MAGLVANRGGWAHLWHGCHIGNPRFRVWRKFECPVGHRWIPLLKFSEFGNRLDNAEALMCPICRREGAVVG